MANRITIQLIGSASDKGDVRLTDFLDQLRSIKRSLAENERLVSETGEPLLDYRIVDLRHASPATVVLEPIFKEPMESLPDDYIPRVFRDFSDELRSIKRDGTLQREPEISRLEAYQHIGCHPESLIQKVRIVVARKSITIDRKFRINLDKIIGPDEVIKGSISGMLESINFHNTNKFTVYPPIGPTKVNGVFSPNMRPQVKEAIGTFVTVHGSLKYKSWSPYPHGVVAEAIDIHPPDESLPKLSELRGAFKGLTGDLSSFEFVEQLRNEAWG